MTKINPRDFSLTTDLTKEGIVVRYPDNTYMGCLIYKPDGSIHAIPYGDWKDNKIFRSRKAAEYYLLALAHEYKWDGF